MGRKAVEKNTDGVDTPSAKEKITEEQPVIEKEEQPKKKELKNFDDNDIVKVKSLLPNVTYRDEKTDDVYFWEEVGEIEELTFKTLKDMSRKSKTYFRKLWLMPVDKDVITTLGLDRLYKEVETFLNFDNYRLDKIDETCIEISGLSTDLFSGVVDYILYHVETGSISDLNVIKKLEEVTGFRLLSRIM